MANTEQEEPVLRLTIAIPMSVAEVISRNAVENGRARKNHIEWLLKQYAKRQLKAEERTKSKSL